ncbi:ankyrin repeat domain-containing protein [Sphingobacterium puteale]|uniref:Ankyrin repeat domain-containing protein n=1 Tax=Sphingobacterium puteale TaxID=2420510 RepID=A0A420W4F7_9SPHI|nr:ankyrin repeat domain-containing protein [Sphingobacterium puteale]RKO73420.1 ankyrin repeat domain-containing protein [Sphingobacterium puteale]
MKKLYIKIILLTIISFSTLQVQCQSIDSTNQDNMTQNNIVEAVSKGQLTIAKKLLEAGADANQKGNDSKPLLLVATEKKDLAMAKLLLAHGANVNLQDNILNSPFLYAGASGYTELVKLYLDHGADFKIFNRYNGTALIPACERGHVETVRLLANTKGFPIDHINRLGWTGLLEAIILGDGSQKYVDIVQILLDANSDKNIADHEGITPVEHARKKGFNKIVALLETKGNGQ